MAVGQGSSSQIDGEGTAFTDVATNGSHWVAVGTDGAVATSTDGSSWSHATIDSGADLHTVAAGDGSFMIGGSGGTLLATTDGTTFTNLEFGAGSQSIDTVLYAQGRWHLTTESGLYAHATTHGEWTVENTDERQRFLELTAKGDVLYALVAEASTDASNSVTLRNKLVSSASASSEWTEESIDGEPIALFGADGAVFVTVQAESEEGLEKSTYRLKGDHSWSLVVRSSISVLGLEVIASGEAAGEIHHQHSADAAAYGDAAILVGKDGESVESDSRAVLVLDSEGEVTASAAIDARSLAAVAVNGTTAVAVGGQGRILLSSDGEAWTEASSDAEIVHLSDLSFSNGTFVAAGSKEAAAAASGVVYVSADAATWEELLVDGMARTHAAIHTDNGVVAVGATESGEAAVSVEASGSAMASASVPSSAGALHAVIEANGSICAAGDAQTLLVSADGNTWTEASLSGSLETLADARFTTLAASESHVVAAGEQGLLAVSADGQSFTLVESDVQGDIRSALYAEGEFVLVGDNGLILRSSDGSTWSQVEADIFADFTAVACTEGGLFVLRDAHGKSHVTADFSTFFDARSEGTGSTEFAAAGNGKLVFAERSGRTESDSKVRWKNTVAVTANWSFSPWFGYLYLNTNSGWVFHAEHDWIYCSSTHPGGMYYYSHKLEAWVYTSAQLYPYLYVYSDHQVETGWSYYERGSASWYYQLESETWVNIAAD